MTAAVGNGVGSSLVGKDPPSLKRLCLSLTMIGWYHAAASFETPYCCYCRGAWAMPTSLRSASSFVVVPPPPAVVSRGGDGRALGRGRRRAPRRPSGDEVVAPMAPSSSSRPSMLFGVGGGGGRRRRDCYCHGHERRRRHLGSRATTAADPIGGTVPPRRDARPRAAAGTRRELRPHGARRAGDNRPGRAAPLSSLRIFLKRRGGETKARSVLRRR